MRRALISGAIRYGAATIIAFAFWLCANFGDLYEAVCILVYFALSMRALSNGLAESRSAFTRSALITLAFGILFWLTIHEAHSLIPQLDGLKGLLAD